MPTVRLSVCRLCRPDCHLANFVLTDSKNTKTRLVAGFALLSGGINRYRPLRADILQPRPGEAALKVGNRGQRHQVIAYQLPGDDAGGYKRHARRCAFAARKLP